MADTAEMRLDRCVAAHEEGFAKAADRIADAIERTAGHDESARAWMARHGLGDGAGVAAVLAAVAVDVRASAAVGGGPDA